MARVKCMVRNCPNHSDEGHGHQLIASRTLIYAEEIVIRQGTSEELFLCSPCMSMITGSHGGTRSDLLNFIHRLTGQK